MQAQGLVQASTGCGGGGGWPSLGCREDLQPLQLSLHILFLAFPPLKNFLSLAGKKLSHSVNILIGFLCVY